MTRPVTPLASVPDSCGEWSEASQVILVTAGSEPGAVAFEPDEPPRACAGAPANRARQAVRGNRTGRQRAGSETGHFTLPSIRGTPAALLADRLAWDRRSGDWSLAAGIRWGMCCTARALQCSKQVANQPANQSAKLLEILEPEGKKFSVQQWLSGVERSRFIPPNVPPKSMTDTCDDPLGFLHR